MKTWFFTLVELGLGLGFLPRRGQWAACWVCNNLSAASLSSTLRRIVQLAVIAFGWWACCKTFRKVGCCDHKSIVSDEVVGMMLSMAGIVLIFQSIAFNGGYLVFRYCKTLANLFNRPSEKLGVHGVMLDDIAAAAAANLVLRFVFWIKWHEHIIKTALRLLRKTEYCALCFRIKKGMGT